MSQLVRTRRRGRGFTIMELMVTMAIAASLMGLGAGLFLSMGKRTAADNALASVSSLVVNVRNASSRFPAMIAVDPVAGEVRGLAQEVRQELHFDPRPVEGAGPMFIAKGIEGRECNLLGAQVEPNVGHVGGALRISGAKVDCGNYAAYDVTDGLTVQLYMKPDSAGAAELVSKGDALRVRLEGGSRITATIGIQDEHGVEKVSTSAAIPTVVPDKWLGVRVSYDRTTITISTDEGYGWVPRGLPKAETRRVAIDKDASLTVGGFSGLLDDFVFAGVHSTDPIRVPNGVRLVGKDPYIVHFLGGRLDPSELGAARVAMEYNGRRTTLEIATNGMLSVSYADSEAPVAEKAGPDRAAPPKKE
jgi:prepilin-type N-terminal cleavage/methylation domain-containing protein